MSPTISQDPLNRSRAEVILEVTFAILVCLASVLGNVLVVYVIHKYSEMQTITNVLIHNLALTDIIMATLNMPFWITSLFTGRWNFSQEWCEISALIHHTMGLASLLTLGLIALNRYMKVVKRSLYIKFFPSKRAAWLYCGLVWLVAVLFSTPPLYGWGKMNFDSHFFSLHIQLEGRTLLFCHTYCRILKRDNICNNLLLLENLPNGERKHRSCQR